MSEGKGVIFILHRLSSARMAHHIYMMKQGTIIESGTHEELIAKQGEYYEMFTLQGQNYQESLPEEMLKGAQALYDTYLLKRIIEMLSDQSGIKEILLLLAGVMVVIVGIEWAGQLLDQSTSNEMIHKAIFVVANLLGGMLAMCAAAVVLVTISPIIAVFPVAGFIVNLLTRYKIEAIHYTWMVKSKKHLRRAEYSERVFYQPEFAKECKMTNVREPLRKQFDEALDRVADAGRKYAPSMTWLSLINWISVFTIFSFFCVPATLGYLALVVKSIALGDVAATNNAANYIRRNLDMANYCIIDLQQIGQFAEKFRVILDYETVIEGHNRCCILGLSDLCCYAW